MTPLAILKIFERKRGKMNNKLTNEELQMILRLIHSEAIARKHIEGTPTEWVAIYDKVETLVTKGNKEEKEE